MTFILCALAAIWFLIGMVVMGGSKSSVHEILAVVAMLCSAVFLSAAFVVSSINRLRKSIEDKLPGGGRVE